MPSGSLSPHPCHTASSAFEYKALSNLGPRRPGSNPSVAQGFSTEMLLTYRAKQAVAAAYSRRVGETADWLGAAKIALQVRRVML